MATSSFNKNKAEATPVTSSEVPATATVTNESTTVAVVNPATVGKVQGYIDRSDMNIPSLKIVNGAGPVSENFDKGAIVLSGEAQLSDGKTPIKLTVIAFRKFYIEKLNSSDYDEGKRPRRFDTPEEVRQAGGHLEWINDEPPPFQSAADATVIIESDTEHPLFPFEHGGKHYALAVWEIRGSAYSRAGKTIATAGAYSLRDGLQFGSWTLASKLEKLGKYTVAVPVLKAGPKNDAEKAAFFVSLLA